MAFNGSGTFTIDTPGNPVQADTDIEPITHNDTMTEIAVGLSTAICRDGQSTITQNISFNNKRITTLSAGVALHDAMNTENLISNFGSYVTTVGGTSNAITLTTFPSGITPLNGAEFWFVATSNNTGAVTIDVNGTGAKNLTKAGTLPLSPSDIVSGALIGIMYDSTRFQLLTPSYAQGTWTPTVGGSATYTTQLGSWTKIGRLVSIHMKLVINTIGTGSTSVISGLPFASYNTIGDYALSIGNFASLATNVVWLGARVDQNATTVTLRNLTAAGATATSSALIGDGTEIQLAGTYCTT